jgi:hypothetical protein
MTINFRIFVTAICTLALFLDALVAMSGSLTWVFAAFSAVCAVCAIAGVWSVPLKH